jgi:hypothetical protein
MPPRNPNRNSLAENSIHRRLAPGVSAIAPVGILIKPAILPTWRVLFRNFSSSCFAGVLDFIFSFPAPRLFHPCSFLQVPKPPLFFMSWKYLLQLMILNLRILSVIGTDKSPEFNWARRVHGHVLFLLFMLTESFRAILV